VGGKCGGGRSSGWKVGESKEEDIKSGGKNGWTGEEKIVVGRTMDCSTQEGEKVKGVGIEIRQ
jgi:hypothetical protein